MLKFESTTLIFESMTKSCSRNLTAGYKDRLDFLMYNKWLQKEKSYIRITTDSQKESGNISCLHKQLIQHISCLLLIPYTKLVT